MKKALAFILLAIFLSSQASAQVSIDYYLPAETKYDPTIPTPQDILGFQVGEWHLRHDQLVNYAKAVAAISDRVTFVSHHRTYENREGLLLTITSSDNHANIDQIKADHVQLTDAASSDELDISTMPAVLWMGYSVHGNEASGSNAVPMVLYYLAAAQGDYIEEVLSNTVILLDPSFNPDGMGRFANWVNIHKNTGPLTTDPNNREMNEAWPGGRTNHYWFDLNRDWLLVQHPESKGRVAKFHEWKPNVLTDHHEMGPNSTFFFQPGIPSRTHPLTPQRNQQLTAAIGEYHAEELDKIQSLYYSEESFDDYYYGKGSTYPDVNGSVGILFEQARSRGHARETIHGILEFPFTIRNQVKTSLSTMRAVVDLREDLLAHMRTFYKEAEAESRNSSIRAYVFGETEDQGRTRALAELISRHEIQVYKLAEDASFDGNEFEAGKAFVVPTNQKQFKLITAMFERRNEFIDSLFYDVSAWTLPYAFNTPFAELSSREFRSSIVGELFNRDEVKKGVLIGGRSEYGYLFEWDEYYAPRAVYRLLDAGARVKVASLPFRALTETGAEDFDFGTIMVSMGIQDDQETVHEIIEEIAQEDGITVYATATGLTPAGMDLGSNNFDNLKKPEVAIIGGDGVASYEVGEAWHLMDTRYHIPVTILDQKDLINRDLSRYNVIVMADGNYYGLSDDVVKLINIWVSNGGTLVTYKRATQWAQRKGLANVDFVSRERDDSDETLPYVRQSRDSGAQRIGGAIFNTTLDLSHPMAYGFNDDKLTVFRNSTIFMKKGENPYSSPVVYTDDPLASGYISEENEEVLANTAAVVISRSGSGRVISMTDNPNFRAYWYGTNKLFANAIFFGHTISGSTTN